MIVLDSAEISLNSLLIWTGYAVGGLLLVLRAATGTVVLSSFGLAFIIITSSYAVRATIVARDHKLREAFELGRGHERSRVQAMR